MSKLHVKYFCYHCIEEYGTTIDLSERSVQEIAEELDDLAICPDCGSFVKICNLSLYDKESEYELKI